MFNLKENVNIVKTFHEQTRVLSIMFMGVFTVFSVNVLFFLFKDKPHLLIIEFELVLIIAIKTLLKTM